MASLPISIHQHCENILGADIQQVLSVKGGDINQSRLIRTSKGSFFLKFNTSSSANLILSSEKKGLTLIASSGKIRTPNLISLNRNSEGSFLLMEYISSKSPSPLFWHQFGVQLADLHRVRNTHFGLDHSNYIGTLPQSNSYHSDLLSFIIEERYAPQIKMAFNQGLLNKQDLDVTNLFFKQLTNLIPREKPSLIHGDLWSGNFMVNHLDHVVLIDPSVSYGPREMDIAMSLLFGGFNKGFYQSYNESYPLLSGWEERMEIYQLYYLLAHLNMFGRSYAGSVRNILRKYQ